MAEKLIWKDEIAELLSKNKARRAKYHCSPYQTVLKWLNLPAEATLLATCNRLKNY